MNSNIMRLSEVELSRLAEKIAKLVMHKETLVSDEKELDNLREEMKTLKESMVERKEKIAVISREIEAIIEGGNC